MKKYTSAVVLLRRDLRLQDNRALQRALQEAGQVYLLFVVDPRFDRQPPARQHARQALWQALQQLDKQLAGQAAGLNLLYGELQPALAAFARQQPFDALYINCDYTPAGRRRQRELASLAQQLGVALHGEHDILLFPPGMILRDDGRPYSVFTPFYRKTCQYAVEALARYPLHGLQPAVAGHALDGRQLAQHWQLASPSPAPADNWQARLAACTDYAARRDVPAAAASSRLSLSLKLGTVSVREAWHAIHAQLGSDSPLLRQLVWRDFYHHVLYHFPYAANSAFQRRYDAIAWRNDAQQFAAWCDGRTGFPLVDAGMRELNASGFMHNRVRMVVASFLVKDLHIDWRQGERYFADRLADYDLAVNNGNWQWAASTGCDAQPYFRIFNPWLQQKKFDPDCVYIKHWLPELAHLAPRQIHRWAEQPHGADYPPPMVDHSLQSRLSKALFAACGN